MQSLHNNVVSPHLTKISSIVTSENLCFAMDILNSFLEAESCGSVPRSHTQSGVNSREFPLHQTFANGVAGGTHTRTT